MARTRNRNKRGRGRPEKPERLEAPVVIVEVGPTPETDLKAPKDNDWFRKLRVEHQGAALGINAGWRIICQGLPAKASQFYQVGGKTHEGSTVDPRKAALEQAYIAWCRAMGARALHVRPVLQIVSEGLQPHEVDIRWRRETGWGAEKLLEGLTLYLKVAPEVAVAMIQAKAA